MRKAALHHGFWLRCIFVSAQHLYRLLLSKSEEWLGVQLVHGGGRHPKKTFDSMLGSDGADGISVGCEALHRLFRTRAITLAHYACEAKLRMVCACHVHVKHLAKGIRAGETAL